MATYAQRIDFENYVEGWTTGDPGALERLLQRAEKDLDRIIIRTMGLTNSIWGITLANATGGSFVVVMNWRKIQYTSPAIPYNTTGNALLGYLQAMTDQYGNLLPPVAWQVPQAQYYLQPWAFGPLPNIPVVVEAVNSLGQQYIPDLTINSSLLGAGASVAVTNIVKGGLHINPYYLSEGDFRVLRDATCAQAEYRNEMGEEFFVRAQWKSVVGPKFRTVGKLPLIGPKAMSELSGSDILQRGARARPGYAKGRQVAYSPVGGTPIPDDWRAV